MWWARAASSSGIDQNVLQAQGVHGRGRGMAWIRTPLQSRQRSASCLRCVCRGASGDARPQFHKPAGGGMALRLKVMSVARLTSRLLVQHGIQKL